jgi:hypothetical protein
MPPRKKRKVKKRLVKTRIGRDLAKDTIGTVQLLDYNDLLNAVVKDDLEYDTVLYREYRDNLIEQTKEQQYSQPSVVNLKRESRKLYKTFKDSLFKRITVPGVVIPRSFMAPLNSWDSVAGGTATMIGRGRTTHTTPPPQEVQAFEIEDQERYMYEKLTKLMDKNIYKQGYPSRATLAKWKKPIASHFKTGGPDFNQRYDDTARTVYRDLFPDQPLGYETPDNVTKTRTRVKKTPLPRDPSMESSSVTPTPVKTKTPKPRVSKSRVSKPRKSK